jgi:uncharacterized cupredoxin-like copper-binding protein
MWSVDRVMLGLAALASLLTLSAAPAPDTIAVHLSNFAFMPNQLRLRASVPVRLHIVNDSTGGHNFSAPLLFSASAFPEGAPPTVPGSYKAECTHFLHSLFGMTGEIIVEPPPP